MSISAKEAWNLIVKRRNELYNALENKVQNEWETYLSELFGYSKVRSEICPHLQIKVGVGIKAIDDITVKISGIPVFLIELKRYCLQKQDTYVEQLKSYLTLSRLNIGVLVCDAVYVYYYDYLKDQMNGLKIDFKTDNEYGIKFIKLFSKETFDKEAVKNYILSEIQKRIEEAKRANELKEKISKIKDEIKNVDIKNLLKDHFAKSYGEAAVTAALNDLEVTFNATNKSVNLPLTKVNKIPQNITANQTQVSTIGVSDDFPLDKPFLIIKTSYERVALCRQWFPSEDPLYNATRHSWNVKYENVIRYDYVLSVIDKKVVEVYKVNGWRENRWENDTYPSWTRRYEFTGEVAPNEIRNRYVGKIIPAQFRKQGMAQPVLFYQGY